LRLGCKCLDELADGILDGSITQVYGEFASGKSTYCIQAAVAASRAGKNTIFIDTENGFSPERSMQMGGRDVLKHIRVYNPDDLSQQTRIISQLENTSLDDVGLIIVDSLVSLYKVDAKDLESRLELISDISLQLLVLSRIARKMKIPVIITNHVYDDIEKKETMPLGGNTVKYWSKVIIQFGKTGESLRTAKLIRHPYLPGGRRCIFGLCNEGISNSDKIYK